MVEEWVKDARNDAKAEAHSRSEIEKTVGSLKETKAKLSEQLKEAIRVRDSSDTGLKNTEKQAKEQRKQLHFTEGPNNVCYSFNLYEFILNCSYEKWVFGWRKKGTCG